MALRLSVLDQSPIHNGGTAAGAVRHTLTLAQAAERLGYYRYWIAEHHNAAGFAGSTPEVLIAAVASETSRLRVGSGGVMLMHYSPLKVAENFRMLEALFPGRIDLGLGRAPGSDQRTARALQPAGGVPGVDQFPYQVADLIGYLHDSLPAVHPYARVRAQPAGETAPEVWLLGSGIDSASIAAQLGCAFSFAQFISGADGTGVLRAYREHFQPSPYLREPVASVAIFVICAETEEEARRLALSIELWRLRVERGIDGPIPSVEEAESYAYSEPERLRIAQNRGRSIVGDPAQVKVSLLELARRYEVDELVIVTITYDFAVRLRSYELIAREFGLSQGSPGRASTGAT